jgi:hypothetical protein
MTSSTSDANDDLTDALRGLVLPTGVVTPYGEPVDVGRYVQWLRTGGQPTLHAFAALIRAAHNQGPA